MKKALLLSLLFSVISTFSFGQRNFEEGERSFMERTYFGGNFALQFGNVTFIDVSPLAGYMVTNNFSVGTGITYQYVNFRFFNHSTSTYGGRVFARRNIGQQFFAHTEFEALNVEYSRIMGGTDQQWVREWVPGVFVGGGMFQPIGRRAGINFMALYNLSYVRGKSPYASPFVIRAGFTL